MIRGSTPAHIFTIPIQTSLISCVRVIYSQKDKVIILKETEDCTLDGNTITTTLTQEETFLFNCNDYVKIQLRIKTLDGKVMPSEIMRVSVGECLEEEVI